MVKNMDHLLSTLANLGEAQLKNFKSKLNEIPLQKGYDNIPKGVLEKADPIELTDKMIQSYQETYAVVVAVEVLRAINEVHQRAGWCVCVCVCEREREFLLLTFIVLSCFEMHFLRVTPRYSL
uniref:Pyrin domain-containing protein n=1 Tax=Chrysemys picta bellii TaxID=8478 RepID=A0A8C3HH63_CHRPI